jgi:hypothetical protein
MTNAALQDELTQRQQQACQMWQAYYDDVGKQVGVRAPPPVLGQHPNDYRRETLRMFKKSFLNHHPLAKINMRGLPDDVLPQFEAQVLEAVPKEAYNPASVPEGELRRVERLDQTGRVAEINWIGQTSFVKDMGRPGRRVVSFTTDRGKYDAVKARWFA